MEPVNDIQKNNDPMKEPPKADIPKEPVKPEVIIIRMWPKTLVLYPMAFLALIFSIVGIWAGSSTHIHEISKIVNTPAQEITSEIAQPGEAVPPVTTDTNTQLVEQATSIANGLYLDRWMGILFLIVFAFSLFMLSVDLEVRWALLVFAVTLVVLLSLILINQQFEFLPGVLSMIASLSPMANPQFYFSIFVIWVVLIGISLAVVRFHYVRIESNEVIVVGGLLERQQRYPTLRMRYTRDIQDVLEYYLPFVNSGRLILIFDENNESLVIDNVLNIDKVTKQLDQISGVLSVKENPNK